MPGSRAPASTYRLQLHAGFGFAGAAAVTDYLDTLGVDAVYTSPYLQARGGSSHGYDVVDHSAAADRNAMEVGSEGDRLWVCRRSPAGRRLLVVAGCGGPRRALRGRAR